MQDKCSYFTNFLGANEQMRLHLHIIRTLWRQLQKSSFMKLIRLIILNISTTLYLQEPKKLLQLAKLYSCRLHSLSYIFFFLQKCSNESCKNVTNHTCIKTGCLICKLYKIEQKVGVSSHRVRIKCLVVISGCLSKFLVVHDLLQIETTFCDQ